MATKIEWATETWNPITGCTKISEGCKNCYAEKMSRRFAGRFGYPADDPFQVTVHEDKMAQPLRWRKSRRVFVCSMGDLFHKDVKDEWIYRVFLQMAECPEHTFMVLTKRAERMRSWIVENIDYIKQGWRADHIWLGVTAENQKRWHERRESFFATPAAVHFVSYEPALSILQFNGNDLSRLDWVICGAETGPGARPMDPDWARIISLQCKGSGVPFFFKKDSDGNRELDGRLWEEFPR